MSKLDVKMPMGIRNFADVTVRNVKTGEIMSTQRVKNVVLQRAIDIWLKLEQKHTISFDSIAFGTGAGVPSKEDMDLFNRILTVGGSRISLTYSADNLTTTRVLQGTMLSTQGNGQTIKEVGLSAGGTAVTKVQLTSPIDKNDLIEIQVTYSFTVNLVNHSDRLTWVFAQAKYAGPNLLISIILSTGTYPDLEYYKATTFGDSGAILSPPYMTSSGMLGTQIGITYDHALIAQVTNSVAKYSPTALTTQKANGGKIKEIQFGGCKEQDCGPMVRLALPCPGIFEYFEITDANQLDASVATFFLKWEGFKWDEVIENSEIIKVNGIAKTRGIDYNLFPSTAQVEWIGTPPGGTVTATWRVPYIPKTSLMMLKPTLTISLNEI